jgi:hypothetical protein
MINATAQGCVVSVPRSRIIHPDEFRFRHWRTDTEHVRMLVSALHNGSVLPPVLLWENGSREDGKLVLLDGAHRLVALGKAHGAADVAAVIFRGNKAEALLQVYEANGRAQLALTLPERADGAWRLVRLDEPALKKPAIAKATGVSQRTVLTMKQRWADLVASGREQMVTGSWSKDRIDRDNDTFKGEPEMTDTQRKDAIAIMAKRVCDAAGRYPNRDLELVAEALFAAFGARLLKEMADYLFAPDEFERDQGTEQPDEFEEVDADADF